jgi:hypothetical protein
MNKLGKACQLDVSRRSGVGRYYKRKHSRAMRRLDRATIATGEEPSRLPFNRYHGWLS